jgi:hypothetical protein
LAARTGLAVQEGTYIWDDERLRFLFWLQGCCCAAFLRSSGRRGEALCTRCYLGLRDLRIGYLGIRYVHSWCEEGASEAHVPTQFVWIDAWAHSSRVPRVLPGSAALRERGNTATNVRLDWAGWAKPGQDSRCWRLPSCASRNASRGDFQSRFPVSFRFVVSLTSVKVAERHRRGKAGRPANRNAGTEPSP